jgi:hypothetical protein
MGGKERPQNIVGEYATRSIEVGVERHLSRHIHRRVVPGMSSPDEPVQPELRATATIDGILVDDFRHVALAVAQWQGGVRGDTIVRLRPAQ